ncbi:hypothetical protein FHG64_14790 [Antarcticibacterium flavum]|uniref:Glycosyl transferase n=1 Tax=Antarcticibacterium flavum TaxID=2058175 RepID=A0A5B7X7G0_9FLAO|nr:MULTISPECIES: hypothetical protein [Antarcticibacterium]MCM4161414.1 hypothetical protein [Antarcticibacterium sp. W02-3]QCY70563.1 hypothetical protein FHG64_14790 [Antarcticibacterium flavum]
MKLAAHITFFHSPERLPYLLKVIEELLKIDENIDIYIYTNKRFTISSKENMHYKIFNYRKFKFARFLKNSLVDKLGIKWLVHPFYLAWENRRFIEELVDEYDVQLYLEDDIEFKKENFDYWLKYKELALKNDFNLGFLRIEKDKNNRSLLTDVNWPLKDLIELEEQKFLINDLNPYCGFWIYDRKELKDFTKSPEWQFNFTGYGVRAKAAVGWHGVNMNRYKSTIIPLVQSNGTLSTHPGSSVHHLPNNYIGKGRYCTLEFPLKLPAV